MFYILFCIILLYSEQTTLRSQTNVSRGIPYVIANLQDSSIGFLTTNSLLVEASVGNPEEVRSQAWNGRFLLGFTLYSFTPNDHIIGVISKEITAERNESVVFNPNTSRWEEFLGFAKRTEHGTVTIGYTHFCKHEIDNFDPPFSNPVTLDSIQKRVTIHGGMTANFQSNLLQPIENSDLQFYIKPHYNFVREDYRYTKGLEGTSLNRLRGTIESGIRFQYNLSKNISLYTKGWGIVGFIESDPFRQIGPDKDAKNIYSGRVEVGFIGKGVLNHFELFVAVERFADDLSYGAFTSGVVPNIGFRIKNPLFF
ncbi:MAG: hypothetical protein JNL36_05470 [Candidatus Kapabacteria bacterium]|nr:hypothetical protein [Candidatus Kapabacteria bacterium]